MRDGISVFIPPPQKKKIKIKIVVETCTIQILNAKLFDLNLYHNTDLYHTYIMIMIQFHKNISYTPNHFLKK